MDGYSKYCKYWPDELNQYMIRAVFINVDFLDEFVIFFVIRVICGLSFFRLITYY